MHEGRRVLPHLERDRPQVLAGDQRVVDQLVERDGLERGVAVAGRLLVLSVAGRLGLECRREPPAARQPQAEPHHDVVARRAVGIEQASAPVDHPHRVVAVAQVAGGLDRGPVADDVEPRDDLVHAVRYVALDPVDIGIIAAPRHGFAVGRLEAKPRHVLDRSAGCMSARNPLRIPEPELTRLARHVNPRVQEPSRQVACIDFDLERRARAGLRARTGAADPYQSSGARSRPGTRDVSAASLGDHAMTS